jgi:predicted RNA binding protein YcfA (HicA-like mRNA interferase family)
MGFVTTATELMSFLSSKGYKRVTGRGKHGVKMVKGGRRISVPSHGGVIKTGTAGAILGQAGYTINDVINWRRQ